MFSIQSARRIRLTLALTALALFLHVASGLQSWCSFHSRNFSALEVHRILTCHWLHWSTEHLAWDLAVFVILGALCERRSPGRYAGTLLLSAAAIPLCMMVWLPQIESYRGLSGIDTALFGLLVADLLIQRIKERDGTGTAVFGLFLAGLFGKIALEMISRANLFVSDASFTPIPLAHLVGAMIGLGIAAAGNHSSSRNCLTNATVA